MLRRIVFTALCIFLVLVSGGWGQDGEESFLYSFLEGTYQVIGQWPDSDEKYGGKTVVRRKGDHLQVIRSINGEEIEGTGRIATATADKIPVLKVTFFRGGRRYEATYLIHSDLDNYARLTGYVYTEAGETKSPGLEAWFIDRQSLKRK
jgi:hypothetical protein